MTMFGSRSRTPPSPEFIHSFSPQTSSPLASEPNEYYHSSPVQAAQARKSGRQSQYKSRHSNAPSSASAKRRKFEENPQTIFLRERLRRRARSEEERRRRRSDEPETDEDDVMSVDGDDDFLNDEIFHRVMLNEANKTSHRYRLDYERTQGSSMDPSLHDVAVLEAELAASNEHPPEDLYEAEDFDELYEKFLAAERAANASDDEFADIEWDDVDAEELDKLVQNAPGIAHDTGMISD